jgi:hypothetical protein
VSLGVAKDQRLSLNPTQISGACGRLMCSLRYEHEFYVAARKRFPKEGKALQTRVGEEKVIANDIFRERVTLRSVEGETRIVPLAELQQELGGAGPISEPKTADDIVHAETELEVEEMLPETTSDRATPAPRAPASSAMATTTTAEPDAPRKPHRRRGRRGGRRNRGGRRPDGQGGPAGGGEAAT